MGLGADNNPFDLLVIRRSCIHHVWREWDKSSSGFGEGNLKSSSEFILLVIDISYTALNPDVMSALASMNECAF